MRLSEEGKRIGRTFKSKNYGFQIDADLNASRNTLPSLDLIVAGWLSTSQSWRANHQLQAMAFRPW
jgi:hypothetical protein